MKVIKLRRMPTYRGQWGYSLIVTTTQTKRFLKVGSFQPFFSDFNCLRVRGLLLADALSKGALIKNRRLRKFITSLQ